MRTRAPIARFAAANAAVLQLNSTIVNRLMAMSTACGYEALLNSVTYPQLGGHIKAPAGLGGTQNCQVDSLFWQAAVEANRCFNPCAEASNLSQNGLRTWSSLGTTSRDRTFRPPCTSEIELNTRGGCAARLSISLASVQIDWLIFLFILQNPFFNNIYTVKMLLYMDSCAISLIWYT